MNERYLISLTSPVLLRIKTATVLVSMLEGSTTAMPRTKETEILVKTIYSPRVVAGRMTYAISGPPSERLELATDLGLSEAVSVVVKQTAIRSIQEL